MIPQKKIISLFEIWSTISGSKLQNVLTEPQKLKLQFISNVSNSKSNQLLEKIKKLTIEKHPSGNVSFIGFWNDTQYRVYRIDFIDPAINEKIDWEKATLWFDNLIDLVKEVSKNE
jgi:hypothetical protein